MNKNKRTKQYKDGRCSCWRKVNKELDRVNAMLLLTFGLDRLSHHYIGIATVDAKTLKPSAPVLALFCPFCGGKLKSA